MKLGDFVGRLCRALDMSVTDCDKIVGAIRRNLSIDHVEDFLGRGSFGIAAAIDKDHVLKLTTDATEIATSHRLVGKKLRHVVYIKGVWIVGGLQYPDFPGGRPVAAIIMERMTGTGTRSQVSDEALTEEMYLARSGHPGRDQASLERRSWDQMLALRVIAEEGARSRSEGLARLAQIADGIEELRELRVYVGDVHHQNVGWKMVDGKLVLKIFDLGISSAPPMARKPPTIEEPVAEEAVGTRVRQQGHPRRPIEPEVLPPVRDFVEPSSEEQFTLAHKSDEELQRIETSVLDRTVFGVMSGETVRIPIERIDPTCFQGDLLGAEQTVRTRARARLYFEIAQQEPIDLAFRKGRFCIQDGHHRYVATKMVGATTILATIVHIEDNPIKALRAKCGYPTSSTPGAREADDRLGNVGLGRAVEAGVVFETCVPVTFRFMHNTEPAPHAQKLYGQDVEPAGVYMIHAPGGHAPSSGWVVSTTLFDCPLVLELNLDPSLVYGPLDWKQRLYKATRKRRLALSKYLLGLGYDGIVTVRDGETSEIVDLRPAREWTAREAARIEEEAIRTRRR